MKDRYQEQINELPGGASTTVDGDEEMERADLRRYLREQMSALPEISAPGTGAFVFNGMSHREIAASTKNPLGTVKTRLELGLQKLHAWLKPVQHKDLMVGNRSAWIRMCRDLERAVRENVGVLASFEFIEPAPSLRRVASCEDLRTFNAVACVRITVFARLSQLTARELDSYHGKTSDHCLPQNVLRLERRRSCSS